MNQNTWPQCSIFWFIGILFEKKNFKYKINIRWKNSNTIKSCSSQLYWLITCSMPYSMK